MKRFSLFGLAMVAVAAAPAVKAAEQVPLTNGFNIRCDPREAAGDKVRLYTQPGSDSFVEVDPSQIASVEAIPEDQLPKPADHDATSKPQPKLTEADMHELVARAGANHNLDVDLLASVIKAE